MSVMDRESPPDTREPWRPGAAFWFLLPAATLLIAVYAGPLGLEGEDAHGRGDVARPGFNAFDIGRTTAIALVFVLIVLAVSSPLLWSLFKTTATERY